MTDPTPTSPLAGANVRTLTARLCEVEAVMAVIGKLGVTLRAEVTERAIARWREDGAAPTYRVPGLGTISLSVPQQSVAVADDAEFASWVAQRYPTEVTAGVTLTGIAPQDLEAALDVIRTVLPEATVAAKVTVAPAFAKRLLDSDVVVADSGDDRAVIDKGTGEVVAGVRIVKGADPDDDDAPLPRSISVRLEPQAKADAEAQAAARLATVLERGLSTGLAAEIEGRDAVDLVDPPMPDMPAVADDHLEADGEPDDDAELCACGHFRGGGSHGGKTGAGACRHPDCDCKRFRAPVVAW